MNPRFVRPLASIAVVALLVACSPAAPFAFSGSWRGAITHPLLGTASVAVTLQLEGRDASGTWSIDLPGVMTASGDVRGRVTLRGLELTMDSDPAGGCSFRALLRPRGLALIATITAVDCGVDLQIDVDLSRFGS
jgi:hypothetical protein